MLNHIAWGSPDGLPVILVHPLGGDTWFWTDCAARLGNRFRTVALDLRGAGASPRPERPVTLDDGANDIETVRAALGIERAVFVGCAVGAMTVARYAARFPDRVEALVLVNPGIRITVAAGENLTMRAGKVRREGMSALLPDAIENAFVAYPDTARKEAYTQHFVQQDPEGYACSVLGVIGTDVSDDIRSIDRPMLLVAGGNDRLLPPPQAEEIAGLAQNAEFVLFEDGAHFIPYQQPVRFADTLAGFLERKGLV